MAGPMILLYEICIWMAYFDHRKARRAEEAEERERMKRLLMAADEPESGEEEDRGDPHDHPDHWDPSDDEKAWEEGRAGEDDSPPESIPDEEKRRMSDLTSYPDPEVKPEEPKADEDLKDHDDTQDERPRP
jgi:hypothetical protein